MAYWTISNWVFMLQQLCVLNIFGGKEKNDKRSSNNDNND